MLHVKCVRDYRDSFISVILECVLLFCLIPVNPVLEYACCISGFECVGLGKFQLFLLERLFQRGNGKPNDLTIQRKVLYSRLTKYGGFRYT